jgi:hypothetical protein
MFGADEYSLNAVSQQYAMCHPAGAGKDAEPPKGVDRVCAAR